MGRDTFPSVRSAVSERVAFSTFAEKPPKWIASSKLDMLARVWSIVFFPVQAMADIVVSRFMIVYMESLLVSGVISRATHYVVRGLLSLIGIFYSVAYWLDPGEPKKTLPPFDSPLLTKSASQLAQDIRNKKVSAEKVVEAFIERIQQVNPIINGIVEDRFKEAIKEAKEVDQLLATNTDPEFWEKRKPFLGVPITIKESIGVKGMSNNAARSRPSVKKRRATEDAPAVSQIRRAGAIPVAVTTTPEMCMNWECYNTYQGITRNPYNTRLVTGGSSGGEAGLLGSAASVIGLGSDLAGSIRIPAFFCGVFGHKTTPGYVPVNGHVPCSTDALWDRFFMIGPMCRYAEDLRPMLTALIPEKNNPASLHLDLPVDVNMVKVYYLDSFGSNTSLLRPIGREMKACLMQVVRHLKISHKCTVTKVELDVGDILAVGLFLLGTLENLESIYQVDDDHPNEWNSIPLTLLKGAFSKHHPSSNAVIFTLLNYLVQHSPKHLIERVRKKKDKIRKCIEDIIGDDGVLVVPTFPEEAPLHGTMSYKFLDSAYMALFNFTQLPVTQCPIFGVSNSGMPLGVQIVAKRGQDRLCLAVAEALQEGFGGWRPPPST